ncbi:MAG: FG-GAP-like repeat-containing protein [Planctomycetaceae bacterium]
MAGWGLYWLTRPDVASQLRDARRAFLRGHYDVAVQTAEDVLKQDPDHVAALILAGDAAFAANQFDRALVHYRRVPAGSSDAEVHARLRCGRIEMHHTGHAEAAEADFRAALQYVPDDRNALFQLASLLGIQARRREALPFVLRLFRQGTFHADLLVLLATDNGALFNVEELHRYQRAAPKCPKVHVGLAWHARNSGENDKALDLLERAAAADPQFAEPRVALAELLWESREYDRLRKFLAEQPTTDINDPELWLVRGQLAEYDGNPESAARCFWESLLLDPVNRIATYNLFQYFTAIKDQTAAAYLEHRVELLLQLRATSDLVASKQHTHAEPVRQLVSLLERTGRLWEAWGWCAVARELDPHAAWAAEKSNALHTLLESAPLTRVCVPIELPFDLSHLPLPVWELPPSQPERSSVVHGSSVTFADHAELSGLTFQYFNDPSPPKTGQYMYEFNGGGCGVIDFDLDGWPDVHLTQGCPWNSRGAQKGYLDRLYRNSGNGHFVDVTDNADVVEDRFSTGVAVGDVDNDGFADLYVANIGGNRMFHNNGDGTFCDVTAIAGVEDTRWSTSCVIADLNSDSLPDIYSVNYLEGESIFETLCQHADGQPRMCMPFHFPGAQDQLFLNSGAGHFINATDGSGVQVPDGKGLGVIAADFQGDGRMSLFVANDTVPNALFVRRDSKGEATPLFEETGMSAGIALNQAGRAEGCMGIAVGDADNDGALDVFVTNFLRESNTFYHSQSGLYFTDRTAEWGLAEPSLALLGFGTQFLDADLDGYLDLIVTNGHIDDYRSYGRPYKMPPQFYHNTGAGRFALQAASQTGPYFTQEFLGRSLARWDWNRDGRNDVVISSLDHPAALLTNTTQQHGRFLSLQLKGVESSRDALGTTVTMHLDDRQIRRQLTAGDGYQASNERRLLFGLSDAMRVKQIDVAWPSGRTDSFHDLEANAEYLLIEGIDRTFRVRAAH